MHGAIMAQLETGSIILHDIFLKAVPNLNPGDNYHVYFYDNYKGMIQRVDISSMLYRLAQC